MTLMAASDKRKYKLEYSIGDLPWRYYNNNKQKKQKQKTLWIKVGRAFEIKSKKSKREKKEEQKGNVHNVSEVHVHNVAV